MRVDVGGQGTYAGERVVKTVHLMRHPAQETIIEAINSIDLELQF